MTDNSKIAKSTKATSQTNTTDRSEKNKLINKTLPMGIETRNCGKTFRVGCMIKGKRITHTLHTLEEAIKVLADMKSGKFQETRRLRNIWNVQEAADAYYKEKHAVSFADKKSYLKFPKKKIIEFFGPLTSLDAIGGKEQLELKDWLRDDMNYAPTTANQIISNTCGMLNYAYERHHKTSKPEPGSYLPKGRKAKRFLSLEEENIVLQWYEDHLYFDIRDMTAFYIDTGCRKSEGFKLMWGDVSLSKEMIFVRYTKTAVPRSIPMSPRVKAILAKRWIQRPQKQSDQDKVWANPVGYNADKPTNGVSEDTYDRAIMELRQDILENPYKLDPVTGAVNDSYFCTHSYRHTCATRLMQSGIGVKTVMHIMGHHDMKTTQMYAQFDKRDLETVQDKMRKWQEEEAELTEKLHTLRENYKLIEGGKD